MKKQPDKSCSPLPVIEGRHVVEFSVGVACQNKCAFCIDEDIRLQASHYAIKTAEDLHPILQTLSPETEVRFGGFEPTTNRELPELIRQVYDHGIRRISIGTNGLKLSDRTLLQSYVDAGLSGVDMSIHGHTATLHDNLVGRKGSFDLCLQALENLHKLKKNGVNIRYYIQTVVTKTNAPFLEEMVHRFESFDPLSIVFLNLIYNGRAMKRVQDFTEPYPDLIEKVKAWDVHSFSTSVRFNGLPVCVSLNLPRQLVGALEGIEIFSSDKTSKRDSNGADIVESGPCLSCACRSFCPGVQKAYVKSFGWEGIHTVDEKTWTEFFNEPEIFRPDLWLRKLVHPFSTETGVGGWRLDRITQHDTYATLHFIHADARLFSVKIFDRRKHTNGVLTKHFSLCFSGDSLPDVSQKFWTTLIRVIQTNDNKTIV